MLFATVLLGLIASSYASHFYVKDNSTGLTCLILDADVNFSLNFFDKKTNETKTFTAHLNETVSVTGDCQAVLVNSTVQYLNVSFLPDGAGARFAQEWTLSIAYTNDEKTAFKLVDYSLETQRTEDIPFFGTFTKNPEATTEITGSYLNAYRCSSSKLALTDNSFVDLKGLKTVAFAKINGTDFPQNTQYEVCYLDARTSDVVPIVVGICLAALVVVVLVAYLIGRARARRQGYASV